MIETVFLDAGGVLVNPNWDRVAAALVRPRSRRRPRRPGSGGAAREEAARHRPGHQGHQRQHARLALLQPRAPARGHRAVAGHGGGPARARRVPRPVQPVGGPQRVPDALGRLRAAGHRLVVVSNANGTLHKHFARLDLARHFDVLIYFHDEGVEKPDPRIFQLALERSGARPETTLHAGDFYHVDVVGARAAGLQAWLIDAGGLYADHDVARAPSLAVMVDRLLTA